jgi:hypothetical protein
MVEYKNHAVDPGVGSFVRVEGFTVQVLLQSRFPDPSRSIKELPHLAAHAAKPCRGPEDHRISSRKGPAGCRPGCG